MIETLVQDWRYGLRMLLAKPGFLAAAVITLALGIGANTAIFSVINGLLLKPLPFDDGERLVQVYNNYPKMGLDYAGSSIPDFLDRKQQAEALEDLALYTGVSLNMAADGKPERLVGLRATPSLFSTLRAKAQLGRTFSDAEAEPGADRVAILSHSTWQSQFAGAQDVLGRQVRLQGQNYEIIGVMPKAFAFPNRNTQVWVPFAFSTEQKSDNERGNEYSESIGRLRPGATIEQLNAQMLAIVMRNADKIAASGADGAADYAEFYRGGNFRGLARSLRDQWVGDLKPVLWLLQAVVAFVLLIACANVANLVLTRVSARNKELALRAALGAGRGRIARQLLIESVTLSALGGAAGICLAYVGIDLLGSLGLNTSQLSEQVGIDATVLAFTVALVGLTGVVFGLFPVISQGQGRPFEVLKEGGRNSGGGRRARLTRDTLVVVQMALAVTLLVGAGLVIKSFVQVQNQNPGFSADGVLAFRIDQTPGRNPDLKSTVAFYDRVVDELRTLPGVAAVGISTTLPFGNSFGQSSFEIVGRESAPGEAGPHGHIFTVSEGYFETLKIPLRQGRLFGPQDRDGSDGVVIVDEFFAKKHFPDGQVLGQRIQHGTDAEGKLRQWTIVGIVANIKRQSLTEEVRKESYFFSYRQRPNDSTYITLRASGDPSSLVPVLRDAVLRADPEQPIYDIKSLDERIRISLDGRKAPMLLLALFAGVALVLSAIGIYGVLAFSVEQRTGELGVRMAIGAQRRDILRLVLKQGAKLAALGLGIGLVGSLALTRFMETQLFNVAASDPLTRLAVVILLGGVALVACWLPARRAAMTRPIEALRYE